MMMTATIRVHAAAKAAAMHRLQGGSSVCAMTGLVPGTGYMVGLGEGDEERIPADLSVESLEVLILDYLDRKCQKMQGRFVRPRYLGTWEHEGEVYLDISEQFFDVVEAGLAARDRQEIEFFDVTRGVCLKTPPQV